MRRSGTDRAPRRSSDGEHLAIAIHPWRRRQARAMGRHDRDWLASLRQFSNRLAVTVQNRFACNTVEIRLQRQMRATCRLGDLRRQLALLRKARHGRFDRPPRDLGGLVEVEGDVLGAEDLLDPLLVVEASNPDLRAVRQFEVEVRFVETRAQRREAQLQHLGHGVRPDAGLRVVEAEPEDGVSAAGGVDRALDDGADEQERLAGARAAAQHDIAGGRREEAVCLALLEGQFCDRRATVVAEAGGRGELHWRLRLTQKNSCTIAPSASSGSHRTIVKTARAVPRRGGRDATHSHVVPFPLRRKCPHSGSGPVHSSPSRRMVRGYPITAPHPRSTPPASSLRSAPPARGTPARRCACR